ncbi:MAG: hypothetical protein ACM319_09795 [Deltaproteobacteria bacterium]
MTGLIAAWFLFILSASAMNLFRNDSDRVGISVAIAALIPILVFLAWFAASPRFRHFVLTLNPRTLTYLQSWRVAGYVFVALEMRGILPALFALPAGYGDMMIGATASLVALKLAAPRHRTAFAAWQAVGIADLIMAVGLGTTARWLDPHGVSMAAMTVLPLSLVPTFFVPLLTIFHVICIAQARAWKGASEDGRDTARRVDGLLGGTNTIRSQWGSR